MSTHIPLPTERLIPKTPHVESVSNFMRWAFAQLQLGFEEREEIGILQIPVPDRHLFDGQAELLLDMELFGRTGRESIALDSRFGKWIVRKLHQLKPASHSRPRHQPSAVNNLAERLFSAYQVTGGTTHLGGCQLTDFPFLRLTYAGVHESEPCLKHIFVAHDGSSIAEELVHSLGIHELEPIVKAPPRIEDHAFRALVSSGRRVAMQSTLSHNPDAAVAEPLVVSLVWVKQAKGTLYFEIGDATATLPFSGWAKLLEPKPFVGPHSGSPTFHLAATDDGRIDDAEQIVTCEHSGERVLRQDLVTCSVTGQQVKREFTEPCPVSGKPTLTDQFETCPLCQQPVSKTVIEHNACQACRHLENLKKDDPRLVWILGEHSALERWSRWRLAETMDVYIAQGLGLTKRILVVVDKETLVVRHLALSSRLSKRWTPIDNDEQRRELLG